MTPVTSSATTKVGWKKFKGVSFEPPEWGKRNDLSEGRVETRKWE